MQRIKFIIHLINRVSFWTGTFVSFLIIPITLIASYEVFSRYFFNSPTIWGWDLNIQLFAAFSMLGGGYTLHEKGHVSVDVFVDYLSPKKKLIVNIIMSLLLFFAMSVLIWLGSINAWESMVRKETMSTIWGPPAWTIKLFIPVGAFFILIQGLASFLEDLLYLLSPSRYNRKD